MNKRPFVTFSILLAVVVQLSSWAVVAGEKALSIPHEHNQGCSVCGMYIREYLPTATHLTFANGDDGSYCGVVCALRATNEHLGLEHATTAEVTDFPTGEVVPLEQTTLVIGSDVIPDMVPNIIAFGSEESAQAFVAEHGGRIEAVDALLSGISYFGMTMPFRVPTAATPPKGVFAAAVALSYMEKSGLMMGDSELSQQDALKKYGKAPNKVQSVREVTTLTYAPTDDLVLALGVPYYWKKLKVDTPMGQRTFKNDGFGDVMLSGRYRIYHDQNFDKHLGAVGRISLPTGEFSNENRGRRAMQLGTGGVGLGGGLLYSQHVGAFWLHAGVEYFHNFENGDDYRFGDNLRAGFAAHWTPSTRTMLGVEFDVTNTWHSEDDRRMGDRDVPNSGGLVVTGNLVGQQRLANIWGGNLNLRALIGIPLYEDLNGPQLGEEFHAMVALQWKRRF